MRSFARIWRWRSSSDGSPPDLPRHGSTQMSVHTLQGALELKELGFTRVVLARELSLPEVEHITKHCGIETECFITVRCA